MGRLNDQDPENTRATICLQLGLARDTQRFRISHFPHSARGTRGYPIWICTTAMSNLEGVYCTFE